MPNFKNIKDLISYVEKNVTEVLSSEEIVNIIKEIMRDVIIQEVYNRYSPNGNNPYERRYDNDGFSDVDNYTFKININKNYVSLTMFNDTEPRYDSSLSLDEIIYYGNDYDWKNSDIYAIQPFPRNWINETVKRLYDSGELLSRMKKELSKRGIKLIG